MRQQRAFPLLGPLSQPAADEKSWLKLANSMFKFAFSTMAASYHCQRRQPLKQGVSKEAGAAPKRRRRARYASADMTRLN